MNIKTTNKNIIINLQIYEKSRDIVFTDLLNNTIFISDQEINWYGSIVNESIEIENQDLTNTIYI